LPFGSTRKGSIGDRLIKKKRGDDKREREGATRIRLKARQRAIPPTSLSEGAGHSDKKGKRRLTGNLPGHQKEISVFE